LSFVRTGVYTFDQSAASNSGHQIAFKDGSGASYTTGVVTTGTPGLSGAQTVITVATNAPDNLRYYCVAHGNDMGNTIGVTAGNGALDTDTVSLGDTTPNFVVEKALDTHYLNDGTTADTSSVTMSDTTGTNSTRTVPFFVLNKELATHYLFDGSTADTSSITITGSGGSLWLSPYTDPYPTGSSYFANDSGNYTTGESTFTG